MPVLVGLVIVGSLLPPHVTMMIGGLPKDGLGHFGAYAALAVAACIKRPSIPAAAVRLTLLIVLGAAVEIAQPVVHRTAATGDLAANLAGIAAGALVVLAFRRLIPPPAASLARMAVAGRAGARRD